MALNATSVAQEQQLFVTLVSRQQIDQYSNVASVAYWLYECFLTAIPEVLLIWSSPWTLIKVLYLLAKYSPLIDSVLAIPIFVPTHAGPGTCMNLYIAHTISLYIGVILAEVMLVYRVWVVWNRDRRLGIVLLVFSVGAATGLTLALVNSFVVAAPQSPLGCTIKNAIGSLQIASLSFIFGYALVLTCLMAIQYFHTCQEGPYAGVFVRAAQLDALVPYMFLMVVSLCSVLMTVFAIPSGYGAIMLRFQQITHSVVACRVILQTKARYRRQQRGFLAFHP